MEDLYPILAGYEPGLRDCILKKLAEIRSYEDDIPAVIIVHDLQQERVIYMSKRGLDLLKIPLEEICLPHAEYVAKYFNPEDAPHSFPKLMSLAVKNEKDELISYFQQVRPSTDHEWSWYLTSVKILLNDPYNNPLLAIALALPFDSACHISTKMERLIQENNFLRSHHHIFTALGRREKEILKLMALGHNSREIAAQLFITEKTVLTHRRNIKNKLSAKSNYDLTRFAQAFDLI